ncbi:MAG: ABC transporter ATP-binding protein [Pirellulaceae bacterium]|nr:ABC transporter ATP-binding protein [Pirellulaceae bacterium]
MPKPAGDKLYEPSLDDLDDQPTGGLSTSMTGCGYLLFVLTVTTGMLITNAIVCLSIHSAVMSFGPKYMREPTGFGPHIAQLFFFIAPVVLTIIQWNLLDRLNRMFRRA